MVTAEFQRTLQKQGTSLMVPIPPALYKALKWSKGTEVIITSPNNHIVIQKKE